jgi:CRP-like cAMP-binding protein
MSQPTAQELAGIPLFASLDPELLEIFAARFEVETVRAGHPLTRQGTSGYAFYIVKDGGAVVTRDDTELRRLGPGDFFGEMSILGDGRRTATVTADQDSTLWVLFGTSFRELEMQAPQVAKVIAEAVAERSRNAGA